MASWKTPYRSALRDLAESLIMQAETKRRNDEMALQMQARQAEIDAEATQNIFGAVATGIQDFAGMYERGRQEQYQKGLQYAPVIENYSQQADELVASLDLLRQQNPNAVSDIEYNAAVRAASQWQSVLTSNPADWARLVDETLSMEIVPAGTPANIFSAQDIADGTAAAALDAPLTMRTILSQGKAYASYMNTQYENSLATLERNAALLEGDLGLLQSGLNAGTGAGLVSAGLAADRITAILESGNLPETLDVATYQSYVDQVNIALRDNPDALRLLEEERARSTAATEESRFRTEIIDWEREKMGVDREFYRKFKELDYESAQAALSGVVFGNEDAAWQAFQTYGFLPSNESLANAVRIMYENSPLRDENGAALSFEDAQAVLAGEHRELMELRLERERTAAEIAGIDLASAQLQYDADEYAATYMTFNVDMAQSDAMRTRIANAITMGDVAFLTSLQTNHGDTLRRLNLTSVVDEAIVEAGTAGDIIDLQNTLAIAELNSAIANQSVLGEAERTAAVMSILDSRAAYMTPEAIDNWWNSLPESQRLMFGTPEETQGLIEGAKRKSEVNGILESDAVFQVAWRRAGAFAEIDVSEGNIAAMQQEVKDILAPVLGDEAANEFARNFGVAWEQGNEQNEIVRMQREIENAKVTAAYEIFQEFGVGALEEVDDDSLETINAGRLLLDVRLDGINNRRINLESQARANGCLPDADGVAQNEGSASCMAIMDSLVELDTDFVNTINQIDDFLGALVSTELPEGWAPTNSEIEVGAATIAGEVRNAFQNNLLGPEMTPIMFAENLINNFLPNMDEGIQEDVRNELMRQVEMMLRDMGDIPLTAGEFTSVPVAPPDRSSGIDLTGGRGAERAAAVNDAFYNFGRNTSELYQGRVVDPFTEFLQRGTQGVQDRIDWWLGQDDETPVGGGGQ